MFNNESQDATHIINQLDDKEAPSMSLGGNTGTVNLNPEPIKVENPPEPKEPDVIAGAEPRTPTEQKEPEPTPEKEKTHGDYKVELESIYKDIESNQDQISTLENYLSQVNRTLKGEYRALDYWDLKQLEKILSNMPKRDYHKDLNTYYENIKNAINDDISKNKNILSNLYSREKEILSDKNYDNRTEDQIRADSSTQIKVDDYIKAGLNPAAVSGYYGNAGGGGGSSSSNDEEERKRKKRERELAEQRKREQRQQKTMQILSMLLGSATSLGGSLGSAAIRNQGFRDMANIRAENAIDTANIKAQNSLDTANLRNSGMLDMANIKNKGLIDSTKMRNKSNEKVAEIRNSGLMDREIIKNPKALLDNNDDWYKWAMDFIYNGKYGNPNK